MEEWKIIKNIFRLKLGNKSLKQITNMPIGLYYHDMSGNNIFFVSGIKNLNVESYYTSSNLRR